eukprot:1176834-Prorocentrum_minimum.AAC.2
MIVFVTKVRGGRTIHWNVPRPPVIVRSGAIDRESPKSATCQRPRPPGPPRHSLESLLRSNSARVSPTMAECLGDRRPSDGGAEARSEGPP